MSRRPGRLIRRVEKIAIAAPGRRRAALAATSERRQRLRRDHPRRDGGAKALAEERSERLIFPGLDVARRPVVQQAEAGDVARRPARSGSARRARCRADPDAELELVIETRDGPEASAPARSRVCVWPFGRRTRRRTARSTRRGRDSRSARICSSASADCRAGTACRHWSRDGCRRRNRCSRRSRRQMQRRAIHAARAACRATRQVRGASVARAVCDTRARKARRAVARQARAAG